MGTSIAKFQKYYLIHNAQEGLHADHIRHMGDGGHGDHEPLQLEAAVLNKGGVAVVGELLRRFLWHLRQHVAQVVALHVLLDLRVQLHELTEPPGDQNELKNNNYWCI